MSTLAESDRHEGVDAALSELERDALTELVNIAISGAAARLRAMVGSEVGLTVPIVEVRDARGASEVLAGFGGETLTAVRQDFEGRLNGQTLLLLGATDGETLARAVLGEAFSDEDHAALRDDTLGEVGNILLLGLLATIGSMLGVTFKVSVPTVAAAPAEQIFAPSAGVVMLIHVDFSVRTIDARGYFALALGLGTFAALREILTAFLRDLLGEEAV